MSEITVGNLISRFKYKISFTFLLLIGESVVGLFYPLILGLAIDDLLAGEYDGVIYLGCLGFGSLFLGSLRRFYDTRVYSKIYRIISPEMVEREQAKGSSVSKISARASLLNEFVEFLEGHMPELIGAVISIVGVLSIIFSLNMNVFLACIGIMVLITIVYTWTGRLNYRLNSGYNNQLEKQVEVFETRDIARIKRYFTSLMRWNIRLSDLEVINYSVVSIGVVGLYVYAPISIIQSGDIKYGLILSILMYVFDFTEVVTQLPAFVERFIRLREISNRLRK